jgi:hypothetical protein
MAKNDPYLEKLLDRGAAVAPKGERARDDVKDPRFGLPSDPESFEAFEKLVTFGRWGIGLHIAAAIVIVPTAPFFPWVGGSAAAAYVLAFVAHKIAGRVRYRRFLGWSARLPFELMGWSAVLSEKRLFCDLCWTDVALRVECNDAARPYVAAALRLLCEKSNKDFYERKTGSSDRRKKWSLEGETTARGSASMDVMKRVRRTLTNELSQIATRVGDGAVRTVTLTADGAEYQVEIEIRSSD